jgi:hypothetical protein
MAVAIPVSILRRSRFESDDITRRVWQVAGHGSAPKAERHYDLVNAVSLGRFLRHQERVNTCWLTGATVDFPKARLCI